MVSPALFILVFFLLLLALLFDSLLSIARFSRRMNHSHQHSLPCLHCHPHSYIRMVQHLIEKCLILHMSQDQCIKALAEHASIRPLVTLTVWRELQKENRDFFREYFHSMTLRTFMRRTSRWAPRFAKRRQWK